MKMVKSLAVASLMAFAPVAAFGQAAPAAAPVVAAPGPAPVVAAPTAAKADAAKAAPKVAAPAHLPIDPSVGQPVFEKIGLQPQVTTLGNRAAWMHDMILTPLMAAISVMVLGLMLWVMAFYRRKANPVASKTSHNLVIEYIWTFVPILILAGIAIPSISLLAAQFKPAPANAITFKAIGNQWYWSYEYPDYGVTFDAHMLKESDGEDPADSTKGERARTAEDGPRLLAADERVYLPVGVPIHLLTTATDVIHSWAVPAFWMKLDAVPGRINDKTFTIDKPGVYFGQCSELCGVRHGFMPIAVEAVPLATFNQWVKSKGGKLPSEKAAEDAATKAAADAAAKTAAATAAAAAPAVNATAPANSAAPAAAPAK
jgi:cytochrome c oxidase subunit II